MGGTSKITYQTMRVIENYKKRRLHILRDSGNTHNFLDLSVAKGLGYKLKAITPLEVTVANGQIIICAFVYKHFTWHIQNNTFSTDLLVMQLGGCEMVLGVQWLATLGDIV